MSVPSWGANRVGIETAGWQRHTKNAKIKKIKKPNTLVQFC